MTLFLIFLRLFLLLISLGGLSVFGQSYRPFNKFLDKFVEQYTDENYSDEYYADFENPPTKYDDFELEMKTSINRATPEPSAPAHSYNFHVDSVADKYRSVRIFLNSFDSDNNFQKLIRLLDENQTLIMDEPVYGNYLVENISNKERTFVLYSKPNFYNRFEKHLTSIKVPAQNALLTLPGFVAIASANGQYVYRWVLPVTDESIVKVTMIHCDTIDQNLRTCIEDILGQVELDVNQTEFRLNMSTGYMGMALRVDTKSSSTGIVRPACENVDTEVGMLNNSPIISANTSHISIEWSMKYPEEGVVYGVTAFNVYYCEVMGGECVTQEKLLSWQTKETILKMVIGELTPATQYRIVGTVKLANGKESARQECEYFTMEPSFDHHSDEDIEYPENDFDDVNNLDITTTNNPETTVPSTSGYNTHSNTMFVEDAEGGDDDINSDIIITGRGNISVPSYAHFKSGSDTTFVEEQLKGEYIDIDSNITTNNPETSVPSTSGHNFSSDNVSVEEHFIEEYEDTDWDKTTRNSSQTSVLSTLNYNSDFYNVFVEGNTEKKDDNTDLDITTTISPETTVPSTSGYKSVSDNASVEEHSESEYEDDDLDLTIINSSETSLPSTSGYNLDSNNVFVEENSEGKDENINLNITTTMSQETSVPSTLSYNSDSYNVFVEGNTEEKDDNTDLDITTTISPETTVPSTSGYKSVSDNASVEEHSESEYEDDDLDLTIINSSETSLPSTSGYNLDSNNVFVEENSEGKDENINLNITTTMSLETSVPPTSGYNFVSYNMPVEEHSIKEYEDIDWDKTTSNSSQTSVPLVPFFNIYNFHIDSTTDERRNVRLFLNLDSNFDNKMIVFEQANKLKEDEIVDGMPLIQNISSKEHAFLFYSEFYGDPVENTFTFINVPAQNKLLTLPGFVSSVSADGEYVYRWVLPTNEEPVVKVSIFQCDEIDKDVRTCKKAVHEHAKLGVSQTEYRLNMSEGYKGMALSVDTAFSSTGIVRPACEMYESEVGMLNESPIMSANTTHISVEWNMQCPEEAVVHNAVTFTVYYCPVRSDKCVEPEMRLMLPAEETTLRTVIGELAPDTRYKISGTVTMANGKESARREHVYTTMEDVVVSLIY